MAMSKVIITTERLKLREIMPADHADLLAIWGDAETMRFYPAPLDEGGVREWIERNLKRYEQHGHGLWAMILRDEERLIGDCGLTYQDVEGVAELEVGYHLNKAYWGRGLATEAARACMDYAFNQLGCRRLTSLIRLENLPSRRVAERNGLRIEKEIMRSGYRHYVYVKESDGSRHE
jgi:[ribosomal protein S5]-alanine N-acetyltransferase